MAFPPDYMGALMTYIRESPDVQSVAGGASPRVTSGKPKPEWAMPTPAVVLVAAGGSPATFASHDLPRVDIRCYGTDERTANDLARRVDGWLFPEPGVRPSGFQRGHTLISTLQKEGGPIASTEPETKWPFALLVVRPAVARQPV